MDESLEKITKEKIEPIIEEAMQKFLGITINELENDITDKLGSSPLLGFEIHTTLPYKSAKKLFKRDFLMRAITLLRGNISKVAKRIDQDRRTVHRDLLTLGIDVSSIKKTVYSSKHFRRSAVDNLLRESIDAYKSVIREEKIKSFYQHTPELSENILKILPQRPLTWKEAESEFDRAYFSTILKEENWNLNKAAKRAEIRYETLLRKIKKLHIK